jgi:hypothetical protein
MTDIENRLRDELRAEAQRAQPHMLRELRVPRRRRAAWAKPWLAPVAAVIAVAAVITGVRFATGDLHNTPAATAQGVLPPFYVTIQSNGRTPTRLMVRRSADGAVVMRVAAPPGEQFEGVSAASDGRTLVLSAVSGSRANRVFRFYRTLLAADGRPGPLTALPLSVRAGSDMSYVSGIALSPGGRQLAVAVMGGVIEPPGKSGLSGVVMRGRARIEVVSLRTGELRTWTASPEVGFPGLSALSWADQGRRLAYLSDKLPGLMQPQDAGMRMYLLDTARPGRDLTGSSALVPLRTAGAVIDSALMTKSGSRVIAWIGPSPLSPPVVLGEFSARTGQLLRVLYRGPGNGVGDFMTLGEVLSADSSGRHLLINGLTVRGSALLVGRLDNGRFTALPSPSPSFLVEAAW